MSDVSSTLVVMKTVTKRQLNQQTATVLAGVSADDPVIVTERGRPRWRIEEAGSADLATSGPLGLHVIPARPKPAEWPSEGGAAYDESDVDRLAAWARGDH